MNKMYAHLVAAFGGVAAIFMLLQCTAAQTLHIVGGDLGWTVPKDNNAQAYDAWASNRKFVVGDTLSFNFQTNQHDVVEVPKESYDSCSSANPIGNTINTGPANITLHAAGDHYYICTFPQHCQHGQKLSISVSAAAPASAPSPSSPPSNNEAPPSSPNSSEPISAFASFPLLFLCAALMIVAF